MKIVRGFASEAETNGFIDGVLGSHCIYSEPEGDGLDIPVVVVSAELWDGLISTLSDIVTRGYGHKETIETAKMLLAHLEEGT